MSKQETMPTGNGRAVGTGGNDAHRTIEIGVEIAAPKVSVRFAVVRSFERVAAELPSASVTTVMPMGSVLSY